MEPNVAITKIKKELQSLKQEVNLNHNNLSIKKQKQIQELIDDIDEVMTLVIHKIKEPSKMKVSNKEQETYCKAIYLKAIETIDYTKARIEYIRYEKSSKNTTSFLKSLKGQIAKLKDSKPITFMKDLENSAIDYVNSPDVQSKIHKVEIATLDLTQKGLDKVSNYLEEKK